MRKPISCLCRLLGVLPFLLPLTATGCQTMMNAFSQKLTHWKMLDDKALDDPIQAVGGDGFVFVPSQDLSSLTRQQLAKASPETLVSYYSPIFVQQKVDSRAQKYPYPPEYDRIGEAKLKREADGKLTSYVSGSPKVYAIVKKLPIEGRDHYQLTYTAWYPAHPRMKAFDVEEAEIDSCVLRVTLDSENAPLFYETIAACGCFHKVFVQKWIEDKTRTVYGPPEKDKKYCVERNVKDAIHWEVAGLVDEPHDQPRRPVVFLKAGEHKVIGMGSAARLRMPPTTLQHKYEMVSYAELYETPVDGTNERAGFFDMKNGGKVRGGERRKEKFLMSFIGVDDAGRPRADDQIKLHFDQDDWNNPAIYSKYLRLPPGTLSLTASSTK
jgi:hypothetical protein